MTFLLTQLLTGADNLNPVEIEEAISNLAKQPFSSRKFLIYFKFLPKTHLKTCGVFMFHSIMVITFCSSWIGMSCGFLDML